MLLIKKKICVMTILVAALMMASCGNKDGGSSQAKVDATSATADEDGNVDINVNMKNSSLHGIMSKKWQREEPSNKEKKIISKVQKIFDVTNLSTDSSLFECIYGGLDEKISVWSLMRSNNEESLDYYGIIVYFNEKEYQFANLCHGKNPVADYNDKTKELYIACDVVEGTGVHSEVLYVFDLKNDEVKHIATLDPYDVQQYFAEKMSFDVKENVITFKFNNKVIGNMVNLEGGDGALRTIVVGEQIAYEFDEEHNIKVNVIPGIKFGPGTNIYYEESPTLVADVKYSNEFKLSNIRITEE
ncbi:MAG: hypothetical protein IKI71_03635 [Lachnospiraceae bacterium]|nr:hypothetical protein [Lachnospiraceae bacterium]